MESIEIELQPQAIRLLYTAVCDAIQHWPGSPARPAQEQIDLHAMKSVLFAMMLELQFEEQ
ncbi:MAG TPA: hypothetical protein DCM40_37750 [Maribacter sp.]|nr:MAG: hypothetical protein Tp158DCM1229571_40 [Prokaryotic dsDNA virus sp.]HAI43441.1 hypothetical protein [Maribacter sp.]|tara:strand:+ start:3311 stop:3493 length:183 start_codon:yes stop_codon:yes gene_type:complete